MNMNQIFNMYNQLRQNPMQMLGNLGIPQGIANNPQAILQHLMNNGRISQEQYNQAVRMANDFKNK
jgi:hypothetical protein